MCELQSIIILERPHMYAWLAIFYNIAFVFNGDATFSDVFYP